MSNTAEFKLCLIGSPGCGKHELMHQFLESQVGVQSATNPELAERTHVYPLTFQTNLGKIKFNCYVYNEETIQGDENTYETRNANGKKSIPDSFYQQANCAILMFDVTSRLTYRELPNYFRDIVRIADNIPICLVGNKIDEKDRKVKPKMIMFHRKKNLQYYDISATAHYNIEKPFLWLIKRLANDPNIMLVETPPMNEPQFADQSTINAMQQAQQELLQAASVALVDESDEE
jgi:GTP-binding nuclear protein Ran